MYLLTDDWVEQIVNSLTVNKNIFQYKMTKLSQEQILKSQQNLHSKCKHRIHKAGNITSHERDVPTVQNI